MRGFGSVGGTGFTMEGGLTITVWNRTGATLLKGRVVKPDVANDDAVILTATSDADPVGIVYEDIPAGVQGRIVILGYADVYIDNVGAVAREQWVGVSTVTAGQCTASGIPGGAADHFREVGHSTRAITGPGLIRCVLHWN